MEETQKKRNPYGRGNYKKDAIKAARELLYDKYVIEELRSAKTDSEIEQIMSKARREKH